MIGFGNVASKNATRLILVLIANILLLMPSYPAEAQTNAELEKQRRETTYKAIFKSVNPNDLRTSIETLSSIPSRVAGYPGESINAANYVEQQFRSILGDVQVDTFDTTIPMDSGVESKEATDVRGAFAELPLASGKTRRLKIHPLWPNLVRTSTLPGNGLTAPLIYVRDGKLSNFNGKDVDGSIVLVDFNCAAEWMNAPRLGARAVIFIAPPRTTRGEAESKFISIPIAIPRFFITQKEAEPLLAACLSGKPPKVTLHCKMPWVKRTSKNFTAMIEGVDPKLKDQIIVVQAYYDSTSVVPDIAPGADTTCGIAAMFDVMRYFKQNPPGRSMMFVASSAHFQALRGIREYVHKHIDEWEPRGWFDRRPPNKKIYLWAGLDMTSQSRSFGVFYKGWFYDYREDIQGRFSDIARVCRENAERVGNTIGFDSKRYFNDGVNPVDGKNWRNYIPGKPAFDSEVITMAGGNGITFATTDDSRSLCDTPYDKASTVNISNLAQQVKLLKCILWHIVSDTNAPGDVNSIRMPITEPSKWSRLALQGGFATVQGRIQMFNPKESFISYSDPRLSDSLVVVRNRNKSFMGVRGNMIQQTEWTTPNLMPTLQRNPDGSLKFKDGSRTEVLNTKGEGVRPSNFFAFHGIAPLTAYGTNKPTMLSAYHINNEDTKVDPNDPEKKRLIANNLRGEIDFAPDLGTSGAKYIPLDVMVTTAVKETPLIVFRCVPTAIFDLVDQQSLRALTGIDVYDGQSNGEPRMYGYAIDPQDPTLVGSYVEDVAVLFSQPGSRLKISMNSGPGNTRLLLVNSDYLYDPATGKETGTKPEGLGYLVAGDPREAQDADLIGAAALEKYDPAREIAKSGAIYHTALYVAEDMWRLDDFRMRRLARYRILDMNSDEGISGLHKRAKEAIDAAKRDLKNRDWESFDSNSRAAWGFESRAYPDVQHMATDVVQGVLFYLALLLPFSYFMERLVFGFYDLKRQLAVSFAIFLAIFACFRFVHPAFDITMNPIIVLLAFIMGALSFIVILMIVGKFEEQIKQMNQNVGGVHKADIGRFSVALAAFNLGVSNMRKRKLRTFLTCVTLVLLTFTVLSFTSVVQTLRFNQVPAPSDYGPRYNGIMIRTAQWEQLQEPAYRLLADEFGRNHAVAPRAWYYGTQMGEQSFLPLYRADKGFQAKAMVGLSPEEAKLTRPQDAMLTDERGKPIGRWFQPGEEMVMILPDTIANTLRIEPADVGRAKVVYSGEEYTVVGILDSQKMKEFTDLDNEIVTPVDFIAMNKLSRGGGGSAGGEQGFKEYTHLEPDQVFFVPYQTAVNRYAELRSIAIDFGEPKVVMERLSPLMQRLGLNLYAGRITDGANPVPQKRGVIERYSSIATTSGRGLELIIFPVLIAALIVLNTMLGSVQERIKEIHIFSSIGLAPGHIGMLFMAEAMVYAILGSVAGYLLGQFTSKILVYTGWLPHLYLNFSSVSAVLTTLIVVTVVLLSTVYPSRKASEVATPAVDRNWRVPEPQGDHWLIPLPFAVTGEQASGLSTFLTEWFSAYEEYSIGDFVTQNVENGEFEHNLGTAYRVGCMTWLAPFDLGVSQKVAIETTPTDTEGVYDITLKIDRESGDISNWKRVNRRFLNTLRKQFLIWRTLKQADRERYLMGGEQPNTPDLRVMANPEPASGA